MIDFSQDAKTLSQMSGISFSLENCVAKTSKKYGDYFKNSNCFKK